MQGWVVVATAVLYIAFLFAVASYGDRLARNGRWRGGRPFIYAFSLCVYCTSWTFFGSAGLAATSGLDFLPVYIGAGLMIGAGYPLVLRLVQLAKAQNITSIADFIASRYGKSQAVAAVVSVIAVVGAIPYIALQLKAISASVGTMVGYLAQNGALETTPILADTALFVALALAAFAILFGTRHIDPTEHQEGMMLAIATESIVKLSAFLLVGVFVTFAMFDGPADLWAQAEARGGVLDHFITHGLHGGTWITITFLSFVCIVLLPRQFHVTVVENNSESEVRRAAWLFPLYLVLINLFVVPIAMAGMLVFPEGGVDADMFVLALPMSVGENWATMVAFIGGLSAATAMVIVASVALSIMVCNDLVVPLMLHHGAAGQGKRQDMGRALLLVRRGAIVAVLLLAYAYYRTAGNSAALASIGLLSFAAIAQLAPVFFGGLLWRRATARGAIAGTLAGFAMWIYTLMLPTFVASNLLPASFVEDGPLGLQFLRPQQLFYLEFTPLTHGVFWSILVNVLVYIGVSLMRRPEPIERLQAHIFVQTDFAPAPARRLWRSSVTPGELMDTVARYLGEERTERSFETFARERGVALDRSGEVDVHLLRFAEHTLASAIGAPSSRLVLSLLLKRRDMSSKQALKLLDDASEAIQYNRDLLQTALDHVGQGIIVLDPDLRLTCWNRQFRDLLVLPPDLGRVGVPLSDILRHSAARGDFGEGPIEELVEERIRRMVVKLETYHERLMPKGRVLEVRINEMPDGGFVVTYTDITERVHTAEELERANETLERRVHERTQELTRLNHELGRAKAQADEANVGKTRFLAAASHDILQPLNAARLYAASLSERKMRPQERRLATNIDASLDAVEEILGAILDISRLDTGAMKPELTTFPLSALLQQLEVEFAPIARDRGLELRIVPSSITVRSDRRLLRRLLQNLVSNAVKYTESGTILVGCRRRTGRVRIEIHDTGPGIPTSKQKLIFKEFHRLEDGARRARGLGLGLSIVERISRVLGHPIAIRSTSGRGSVFATEVPTAAVVPPEVARRRPTRRTIAQIGGLTVMCIDNEQKILDGMATLIGGWGCRVLTATSTKAAIKLLKRERARPDLLLVDYHLDEGNGIEAVVDLRWKLDTEMPAILITADRSPQVRDEARAKDIAVLYKPLKAAALRALMAQRPAKREAAE